VTAIYVPGTEETDPKRIIMSQQLVAGKVSENITAIATNTTNIATNTASIAAINAAWVAFTPSYTWGTVGGTPATFTTNLARYKQIGKLVTFQIDVTMDTVGVGNGAGLIFDLPATATASSLVIGSGKEKNITGTLLALEKNTTTTGYLVFYDNSSPVTAGAGARFQFGATYESA
jgi:hypothetical protein